METLTLDRLMEIMRECAGEEEGANAGGDIGDTEFAALGYDSLALLETAARIEREYQVRLGDETVTEAKTPGALLSLVNRTISEVV
ncbi:acyl carrier protein [Streptomyces nigrescens]|nr:acyl carrier protein [Streptomyces nigrescens]